MADSIDGGSASASETGKVGAEAMGKGDKGDLYDDKAGATFRLSSSSGGFWLCFLMPLFLHCSHTFARLHRHKSVHNNSGLCSLIFNRAPTALFWIMAS